MAKYSIINFTPAGVVLNVQCDSDADLEEGFRQFSKLVGQEVKYEDLLAHPLANGTMYQVTMGPDDDRDEQIAKYREVLESITYAHSIEEASDLARKALSQGVA